MWTRIGGAGAWCRGTGAWCRRANLRSNSTSHHHLQDGWGWLTRLKENIISKPSRSPIWKVVGVVIPGSLAVYHMIKPLHHHSLAYCKHYHAPSSSRRVLPIISSRSHDKDQPFNWWLFIKFILPDAILLLVAVGSAVVAALLNITIPLELGHLINSVSQLEPGQGARTCLTELIPTGSKLLALYVAQAVSTFVYITVLSVSGERLAGRMREGLFTALLKQDIAFFDTHKTGELVGRLSGDVQELKSSFKMVISQGLRSVTQVLGCVTSLYFISPQMTMVVGVALPVMVTIGTAMGSILRRWSRKAQEQVAIATGVADEAISNVRTVRAFAMEDNEQRLYQRELNEAHQASSWLGVGVAIFQGMSNLAINGVILVVVGHGGLLLATNQVTPGNLMAFLVATQTIQRSLASLSVLFGQVVRGLSAGGRVFEYMEACPTVPLRGGVVLPINTIQGDVTFEKVTFSYPTRPNQQVLNELSLSLPAGKVTALCGLSGAGKSTVAALLERFYEPDGGVVMLDGKRLVDFDPSWLRGEVLGYISQEPVLFGCSIMENIRYGRPSASDLEVMEAARMAYAHKFIQDFPEGYSTLVGERGIALSGGQKQRVAIARALLKNPPILILDEATSALDAQSEKLVQQALDVACQGRTVLIIAHRLSTICEADQIIVLHKGKLEEVGSHKQLLAKNGLYSELIRRQTSLN